MILFLSNDLSLETKWLEIRSVGYKFERIKNYFTVGRNRGGKMIKCGDINVYIDFQEVVPLFSKVHDAAIDYSS